MKKYKTCHIRYRYEDGQNYHDVSCGKQLIYSSRDPLYSIVEVILNHFDEQGWVLDQALNEKNFSQIILIFRRKGM